MTHPVALDRIRIVLTRTSHPGNIGAAARALKTMGLKHLYLVQPTRFPHPEADARSSGARDVLEQAVVVDSLDQALNGTVLSFALTARQRELAVPPFSPRPAAAECIRHTAHGNVALVFGAENSGLRNDELALCSMPVHIPANPAYSSLNLAAAVQILSYEMRLAALEVADASPSAKQQGVPATFDEVEGFYDHLERAMIESRFFDPSNPGRLMQRLRRLFGRVRLERDEVNILRGILSALQRKPD